MNPLRLNLKFLISSRLKVTILLLSNLRYRACGRNNLPSLAFTHSTTYIILLFHQLNHWYKSSIIEVLIQNPMKRSIIYFAMERFGHLKETFFVNLFSSFLMILTDQHLNLLTYQLKFIPNFIKGFGNIKEYSLYNS